MFEMIISVQLHTILQRQTPEGLVRAMEVSLSDGCTIADLIAHLGIKLSPDALLIAVNGRVADVHQPLSNGDHINLMPAISGG
ncbi:MAG: hypothetical protein A2W33_04715 [Chloroflexi bacterium RBG_16_52_11]|nr:MAG: hypothetical protein A2W33_04715 [Chloroflexi bacterium RBG_16_52_11]